MENNFFDVNIALANELARIADDYEGNVWEAVEVKNKRLRVNIDNLDFGVGGNWMVINHWFLTEITNMISLILIKCQVNDSILKHMLQ